MDLVVRGYLLGQALCCRDNRAFLSDQNDLGQVLESLGRHLHEVNAGGDHLPAIVGSIPGPAMGPGIEGSVVNRADPSAGRIVDLDPDRGCEAEREADDRLVGERIRLAW